MIDVGANIGTFSIPLAMNYPNCEFIAFEPQRIIFHNLVSNVFLNPLSNITLNRNAISDPGQKQLRVPLSDISENYTGSVGLDENVISKKSKIQGIAEPGIYSKNYDVINVMKLDEVFSSSVSLIKIDVEGMELSVLKSAMRILEKVLQKSCLKHGTYPNLHMKIKKYICFFQALDMQALNNEMTYCVQKRRL